MPVLRIATLTIFLAQTGTMRSLPATDITAADVQATLKQAIATKTIDTPMRTIDAGGHNVGVEYLGKSHFGHWRDTHNGNSRLVNL